MGREGGGGGRGGDEEYIRLSQTVTNAIQQIASNVTAIQRLTNDIGTPKDTQDHRDELSLSPLSSPLSLLSPALPPSLS